VDGEETKGNENPKLTFSSFFFVPSFPQEYREGKLLSGQLKKMCVEKLQAFVAGFQQVRRTLSSFPLSFRRVKLTCRLRFPFLVCVLNSDERPSLTSMSDRS